MLSNLMGKVKGAVANMLVPPVPIRELGNEAMLDFAQAIVDGQDAEPEEEPERPEGSAPRAPRRPLLP